MGFTHFFTAVDSLKALPNAPPAIAARGSPARVQWRAVEEGSALRRRAEHLEVLAVRYGSKGIADLAGFGEIVGHIKDFFLKIIEMRQGKGLAEEELRARRIENASRLLDVYERTQGLDLSSRQRQALVANIDGAQELFLGMAQNGQVTDAEVVRPGDPDVII